MTARVRSTARNPTDLGFTRQAAEFERVLRPVLK
jgi:hypothetical protein